MFLFKKILQVASSGKTVQKQYLKHVFRRLIIMKNTSVLPTPAGNVVCVLFSMTTISCIVVLPTMDIRGGDYPVLKGPRPYKACIADISYSNNEPDSRVSKDETSFYPIINKAADKHDVDPALIKAIIMAESRYNPMATSEKGAIGLMQIMPRTASAFSAEDMYDPVHNINAGVEYLKNLLNQFEGNLELALAAYNAGPGKVKEYRGVPPYEVTILFVKRVFEYYRYYLEA
jgi:hypothetical protein